MFFKKINKLPLACPPPNFIVNKVNFIFIFLNEIKSKINLLDVFAALLVSLAWSCTSGDATDFSERSTSSELSPASGDDAGQSDALSLEGEDQVEKTSPYDASYDGSDGDTGPQGPQVGKPSTSPYYASYDPPSGVLTISAPEIQERKLKLTPSSYRVTYIFSKKNLETGAAGRILSYTFGTLSTSKHHIYFHYLKKLEKYLRSNGFLMEHANYDHITLSSKNHVLSLRIGTHGSGPFTTYYTLPPDNLRDFFIILGRYPLSTLGSPSTNPSEAVAKMFATQIIPLLPLAPSEQ